MYIYIFTLSNVIKIILNSNKKKITIFSFLMNFLHQENVLIEISNFFFHCENDFLVLSLHLFPFSMYF